MTEYFCPKCKSYFPIDQPVIIEGAHGYVSKEHGCGKGYFGFILSSKDPVFSEIRGEK